MSVVSNECVRRLRALGITDADPLSLDYLADDVRNEIRIYCHREDIPEALEKLIPDNVCGRYIQNRLTDGTLSISGEDINAPAQKSVSVGDVSVTFAAGDGQQTAQQRIQAIAAQMSIRGRELWKCFRKVKWK